MTDEEAVELMAQACLDEYSFEDGMKAALTVLKAAGWQHVPEYPEINTVVEAIVGRPHCSTNDWQEVFVRQISPIHHKIWVFADGRGGPATPMNILKWRYKQSSFDVAYEGW